MTEPKERWPRLMADIYCPTWWPKTFWQKLLRKQPGRRVYRLSDGRFICSPETKAHYETSGESVVDYVEND